MEQSENNTKLLKLYLGSYEGKVFEIDLNLKTKKYNSIAFKVSDNSIKVIHHKNKFLFVSGNDEIIHILDMKKREDKGMVVTYSGSVSNIQIINKFLLASGDDSNIAIWRMSDFSHLQNLKGHKASVTYFTIHKSGKFVISAAKDFTVIIWNLTNARKIIKYNFKNNLVCFKILLIKQQSVAVLIFDNGFWLFDLFKNSESHEEWVIKRVKIEHKIIEAFNVKDKILLVHPNGEAKIFYDIFNNDNYCKLKFEAPIKQNENDTDIRVKLTNLIKKEKIKIFSIVYTNGEIYMFDINKVIKIIKGKEENEVVLDINKYHSIKLNTSDRITCMDSDIN